ncbi:MAG: YebC/PmpR family DNA-binding transcriptional regulator [Candidatus Methylomirabilia bacterium]
MSGHSRWAQIKRKKAKTDQHRGKLFTKLIREITAGARAGGDPKVNMRLKAAIESAKAASMPAENIQRAILKGTGELSGEAFEEVTYEGYGPGGVAIMARILTDNKNRAGPAIRHIFEKHGGNLGTMGCVSWMFERKGAIQVDAARIGEDELLATVLDAGAADMRRAEKVYEISTAPDEMEAVRQVLEQRGVPVLEAEVAMVPLSTVRVEGKEAQQVLRLIEALEEEDDVQTVYANYDIPEDVMEAVSLA